MDVAPVPAVNQKSAAAAANAAADDDVVNIFSVNVMLSH